MVINLWVVVCFFCVFGAAAHAESLGRTEYSEVASVNGRPAICLSKDSSAILSVGWVTLSESYAKKTGVWGLRLQDGASPLVLNSGECFSYGFIPEGYKLRTSFGRNEYPLVLEVNKTYVFRLNDAKQSTNAFQVVFCVNKTVTGAVEYLQYTQLPNGGQIVPVCDGKRNADGLGADDLGNAD